MKPITLLLLFLLSFSAYAVDPLVTPLTTINCALPVDREDNTSISPGKITEIRFYTGTKSGVYDTAVNTTAGICQWVIDNTTYPSGTTLYIVVTAVDDAGRESAHSTEIVHPILVKLPPKAPVWLPDS